jgi:putative membrane protein
MLSGAVAICAMILPGISGAFILVLLGKYQHVLAAVNNRDVMTIAFVAVGAVIGLVTFAQILNWLFKHYHDITVAALTGLMVGSLRKVWPWKVDIAWLTDDKGEFVLSHGERIVTAQQNIFPNVAANMNEFLTAVLLAVIGLGVVLLLERLAHR